jgi:hypothetical protein
MNRRSFLKESGILIAAAPLWSATTSRANPANAGRVLKGFIVSDAHFGWQNAQQPSPGRQRELIAAIHRRFPDLDVFLDTGDAHHGSLGADVGNARREWSDVIANNSNGKPFYYVPGNHDIVHPADGDAEMRIRQLASMSYRPYYSFDIKGIHFISVPQLMHPVHITRETLDWIHLDLSLNRDKSTVLLSHNNLKGTTGNDNFMTGYRGLANSDRILNLFKEYPNILAWMHGHNHDYVIRKSHGRLFVSNGRIGGFNPKEGNPDGQPLGGIYFEISPSELKVKSYSAEDNAFLQEDLGLQGRSGTLEIKTSLDPQAPMSYAFGHGGFLDGQRAAVYNHHTSPRNDLEVFLAGTVNSTINDNPGFTDYTHRNDTPEKRQWDVFGHKVQAGDWPDYFEEENPYWRWLNPGVLILGRDKPDDTVSLHLPGPHHGRNMYYRAVPGKGYAYELSLHSRTGGQAVLLTATLYSQEGKELWKKRFPRHTIKAGQSTLEYRIDLPGTTSSTTIYSDDQSDTEAQIAIEACFSSMQDELIVSSSVLKPAGARDGTLDPSLRFEGEGVEMSGELTVGYPEKRLIKKPRVSRMMVEGHCSGSQRMLWYCRQVDIDWQVRNAPVADHGTYLEIDAPTNIWSTRKEIVVSPAGNTPDSAYVNTLRDVTRARIWPLNRGNSSVSVEILSAAGDSGTVGIRCARKPKSITGAETHSYDGQVLNMVIAVGQKAVVKI